MRAPAPPPDLSTLGIPAERQVALREAVGSGSAVAEYLPWDKLRFKTPPPGLSVEEWWWAVRTARRTAARPLPSLLDVHGRPFTYGLPDPLLADVDRINRYAGGTVAVAEQVTNPGTRDRYLVSSLIEEATRSSQLEGASTTRRVAKEMLRSGRAPRDHSERMIANNFAAMRHVAELRDERLSPELVRELHRIVTHDTLTDPADAGRLQTDDEQRVHVWSDSGEVLHTPPPTAELPERLDRLCAFAEGEGPDGYIPPVLRAVALHFMMGYDHYFEDGNGRTARAVFYWSMLRQGYWFTEFLTISAILKNAPAQYARAFLLTEQDEGDLTYFFLHQTGVILRAVDGLRAYLDRKSQEVGRLRRSAATAGLNHRQLELLEHAARTDGADYSVESHRRSHGVAAETARQDLLDLEARGWLVKARVGRRYAWGPAPDLAKRLT